MTALVGLVALALATPAAARETVEAAAPSSLAVTLYRDPARGVDDAMNRQRPRGFAMITETRQVVLPPGESTIRFTGVAEGMVAVSAIVTGLPGGTIEKNRNADLLSPAALVDGTLGNRVTVTRTNPATGEAVAEDAVVRTRADGGIVLETSQGFEAVRCSGLPEKLTFERVPAGLSAQPVFSVDTRDPTGGTYDVQLTYLAWGFDWQANYVATLAEGGRGDRVNMRLMSWVTLLNDNGQSFENAELLVVAGKLNVVSDFQSLAAPPDARPLSLTCFPIGSTAAGTPIPAPPPPPMPPPMPMMSAAIVVTGSRVARASYEANTPVVVMGEEALGDLKLYRAPERVTVAAKGLKQIAFLDMLRVEARLLYLAGCTPYDDDDEAVPTGMMLATVNDKRHGLGAAMPMGGIAVFEPSSSGEQLVGEESLRDYAVGQDVEIRFGDSSQVFAQCVRSADFDIGQHPTRWNAMHTVLTNANPHAVTVRIGFGYSGSWQLRGLRGTRIKDGEVIYEVTVPANGRRELRWESRQSGATG
ncbi:MAG: hypothetical protein B7Z08_11120 [Sphingomonadales bacterium 32-68-7]|nr:MAG: hypothetical protein B7Z33_11355 [Sphingomonadales bacterium 12-68-11]OYX08038.1 MAG: hypothetical protein B7Z08_11120 [Sphingomonadales bacterium 32-68-7]